MSSPADALEDLDRSPVGPGAARADDPGPYRAPWWLPGGHAQTIYASLCTPAAASGRPSRAVGDARRRLRRRRPRRRAAGGAARRAVPRPRRRRGQSLRARAPRGGAAAGLARGVPHFRGCSGEPNRLPRAYHSGDSDEIDWILRRLAARGRARAALRCRRLARRQRAAQVARGVAAPRRRALLRGRGRGVRAARSHRGRRRARAGFSIVYARHFLATLKPKSAGKARALSRALRRRARARARTLREFDDLVTAPLHGFRGRRRLLARARARSPGSRAIAVPTLVLNARERSVPPGRAPAARRRGVAGRDARVAGSRRARRLRERPVSRAAYDGCRAGSCFSSTDRAT